MGVLAEVNVPLSGRCFLVIKNGNCFGYHKISQYLTLCPVYTWYER